MGAHRGTIRIFLAAVALSALMPAAPAETAVLRGGTKIDGTVLKRDDKAVVFDLGFDVLRVPADRVLEVRETETDTASAEKTGGPRLYESRDLKLKSAIDNIDVYSPAVLVIRTPKGLGSGFFINRDGYIVTNFHVIKGERHITVTRYVQRGKETRKIVYKKVRIVAIDPFHDLAALKVDEPMEDRVEPVVFASSDAVKTGETVFVIGNPLGLERTVTEGVLSNPSRNFGGNLYLQIDAPVNPGNSGGPLFNSKGQVIGVINMGILAMEGLNFAIPIRDVKFLLDNLEAYAFDENDPLSGYYYPAAPRRPGKAMNDATNQNKGKK